MATIEETNQTNFNKKNESIYPFTTIQNSIRRLTLHLKDKQQTVKLLAVSKHRDIFLKWSKDKECIDRLFFDSKNTGKLIKIHQLITTDSSCETYQLTFSCNRKILFKSRSLELEQNFFNLSNLLGYYELEQPTIFPKSKYSWIESTPIQHVLDLKSLQQLNFKFGLLHSLVFTLDLRNDVMSFIDHNSDFSQFPNSIYSLTSCESLLSNLNWKQSLLSIDEQTDCFIDGFILGYRKILASNITNEKLHNYAKLLSKSYLKKLTQQVDNINHNDINYEQSTRMSEQDLSNQIELIRQQYQ